MSVVESACSRSLSAACRRSVRRCQEHRVGSAQDSVVEEKGGEDGQDCKGESDEREEQGAVCVFTFLCPECE